MATEFTYPEVGATRPGSALPKGYHTMEHRMRVGTGRAAFDVAGESVVTFRMHAGLHLRPNASTARAEAGTRITVHLGPKRRCITAPCEVVWVIDEPRRRGFAYGTLPGHPESGEEAFIVDWDEHDGVWLTVRVFSVGAQWYTKAPGPLIALFLRGYAFSCAAVLRRIVRTASAG